MGDASTPTVMLEKASIQPSPCLLAPHLREGDG